MSSSFIFREGEEVPEEVLEIVRKIIQLRDLRRRYSVHDREYYILSSQICRLKKRLREMGYIPEALIRKYRHLLNGHEHVQES